MREFFLNHEPAVRLAAYALVFAALAVWERYAPWRVPAHGGSVRWPANLGLIALDTALVRVLFPTALVGVAQLAQARGWGLFNLSQAPTSIAIVASLLLLDLAIYLQHVAFHAVPALWRLHRVHHADLDLDATTGVRFHPLEIALSLLIKFGVVAALGVPPVAVLLFEVLLNTLSMFNHANVRLPARVDRVMRLLVVTPDVHRVHHSVVRAETDSNFGFNFPWWDRLFGTYRPAPAAGSGGVRIGLTEFREPEELRLSRLITQPFRNASIGSNRAPAREA